MNKQDEQKIWCVAGATYDVYINNPLGAKFTHLVLCENEQEEKRMGEILARHGMKSFRLSGYGYLQRISDFAKNTQLISLYEFEKQI